MKAEAKDKEIQVFEEIKSELNKYDLQSVAEAAEVSLSTLYNWLIGKTIAPRISTLEKVAEVLDFKLVVELKLERKQAKDMNGTRHLTVVK